MTGGNGSNGKSHDDAPPPLVREELIEIEVNKIRSRKPDLSLPPAVVLTQVADISMAAAEEAVRARVTAQFITSDVCAHVDAKVSDLQGFVERQFNMAMAPGAEANRRIDDLESNVAARADKAETRISLTEDQTTAALEKSDKALAKSNTAIEKSDKAVRFSTASLAAFGRRAFEITLVVGLVRLLGWMGW